MACCRVFDGCSGEPRPASLWGRGRTCTGIEEHLDQMHCDLCLRVDSDNPMTNLVVSRDSSVRNKLNLHHAARSAAAAALPFDKPFCCHLPPPHISIASQPHSLCLLLFTSLTIPFLHLRNHQPRSNISLARSRHLVALVASFIIHATCKLYSYSGGNYGVLEPEAS